MKLTNLTRRQSRQGLATLIAIMLLGLISVIVQANSSVLSQLHSEMKVIEKEQIKRLTPGQPTKLNHG